jgi:hypothetical protein
LVVADSAEKQQASTFAVARPGNRRRAVTATGRAAAWAASAARAAASSAPLGVTGGAVGWLSAAMARLEFLSSRSTCCLADSGRPGRW